MKYNCKKWSLILGAFYLTTIMSTEKEVIVAVLLAQFCEVISYGSLRFFICDGNNTLRVY